MKHFPKHLNNRFDYEYVRDNFSPEQWLPAWRALLDNRYAWKTVTEPIEEELDGTEGASRIVEECVAPDRAGEARTEMVRQVLMEDENALLFRLGFTVREVAETILRAK